ncbi:MAG: O-antigen ligase family protein [Methylotenera sp.]|uniref:O-antigen ligase family protein n=1 Tax=Methylotenera sp. TaxID=2051956 RepID=UPI0024891ED0|nr:O-antigen ligase family protein [Methylotenera sp.]MDI1310298.1 O-antigen ligase family protein [Methylotenera sp.]
MQSNNISTATRFFIFLVIASLVTLSPSLKVIPRDIIVTSFHDNQRLVELLLVTLVLLYSAFSSNREEYSTANQSMSFMLYMLMTLAIASSCLAISQRHAALEISLFAGLSYLAIFIANLYHENKTLLIKRLTYMFWASILLCMVSFYVGYITAIIFSTPVKWPNPLTGFSNIRFFNQYQLWTLGLITLPLLKTNFVSSNSRRWLHLALSFWFVLLFFSASRGALLAWIFGISITAIVYKKSAWSFIRLQIIHLSTGYLVYKILFFIIPSLMEAAVIIPGSIIRDTTSDRLDLWKLSLNLIQEHPYFGIGPMSYAWVSKISSHPHNSVLQLMSEWGLPAAFIIFYLVIYGLISWLRKFNAISLKDNLKFDSNLAIILFFTLCTCSVYSLVDGVIVMPISQVMMFTFIGLAIGFYSESMSVKVKHSTLFKSIFASIVLVALIWSTLPEILQSAVGNEKHFSISYTATGPRIWVEVK